MAVTSSYAAAVSLAAVVASAFLLLATRHHKVRAKTLEEIAPDATYNVRFQKSLIAASVTIGLVAWFVLTVYQYVPVNEPQSRVTCSVIHTVAWFYTMGLCTVLILSSNFYNIFRLTCHVAILAALLLIQSSILLLEAFYPLLVKVPVGSLLRRLDLMLFATTTFGALVLLIVTLNIPRAPEMEYCNRKVIGIVRCTIWQQMWFTYTDAVQAKARKAQNLEQEDLDCLPLGHRAAVVLEEFSSTRNPQWTLLKRLLFNFKYIMLLQWTMGFLQAILTYLPAYFLLRILTFLQTFNEAASTDPKSLDIVYCYTAGLFLVTQLSILFDAQLFYIGGSIVQVNVRSAVNLEVYSKALRKRDTESESVVTNEPKPLLKPNIAGTSPKDTGQARQSAANLMTIDADRIAQIFLWSYLLIQAPAEIIISATFLFKLVGWAAAPGFAMMCFFVPLSSKVSSVYWKTQDSLMKARDSRVGTINEILQSIRQIKFQADEDYFSRKARKIRETELHYLSISYYAFIAISFCYQVAPVTITVITFGAYALFIGDLTPSVAFTSLVIMNQMRFALNYIPALVIQVITAWTSIKRVDAYLATAENSEESSVSPDMEDNSINFKEASIKFASSADSLSAFMLRDITAHFPAGKLSLITGPTGSGKSLLLSGLMGEADITAGTVGNPCSRSFSPDYSRLPSRSDEWILPNTMAYVAQTAWLENKSIKENILFGASLNQNRYAEVLQVCGLAADLAILQDGDLTEIGEKGLNLSGGQKARVSLARAAYSRASVVVMDDVLSALDAHIAKHVFENCINGRIMQNRTRILVTHQVSLCLKSAYYMVALADGCCGYAGRTDELVRDGALMMSVVARSDNDEQIDKTAAQEELLDPHRTSQANFSNTGQVSNRIAKVLVDKEAKSVGNVSLTCYLRYLALQGNPAFLVSICALFMLELCLITFGTYWIRSWSAVHTSAKTQSLPVQKGNPMVWSHAQVRSRSAHGSGYWVGYYLLIMITSQIAGLLGLGMILWGSLHAGRKLHASLLDTILRVPLRFLDTVPTGRLLNRFSKDTEAVDSQLGNDYANTIKSVLRVIFILVICVSIQPRFAVAAVLLICLGFWVGFQYISATRALKRLHSVARSPIYELFSTTISGITTIRAYGCSDRFMETMFEKVDDLSNATYHNMAANRWLSVRFDTIGNLYTVGLTLFLLHRIEKIDAGIAGFTLTFALELREALLFAIRYYAQLEQGMNSVERIFEYTDVETEGSYESEPERRPPADWPVEGVIEFKELELRYAPDLPAVLHGISVKIKANQKIGIVGRTGSGKSTMTLALFRFLEASSGSILLDGLDISHIGLHDLRSRLTIVPQEPTLFQGTLRSNLSEEATDEELRSVLHRVQLVNDNDVGADANVNSFRDLETKVSEGGSNFSAGQRQLLCLARALLRRTKIIVMDEATASVSTEIDALIQKTIRSEFVDSTVITVAHRLDTIIDYDQILVLGEGRVLEYDTPSNLLKIPNSAFSTMVAAANLHTKHSTEAG